MVSLKDLMMSGLKIILAGCMVPASLVKCETWAYTLLQLPGNLY